MKKFFNRKGFSIIELMAVVLIIGILVALAAPIYADVRQVARENAHDANVRVLTGAANIYLMDGGKDAIWAPFAGDKAENPTAVHDMWGKHIEVWPESPFGGTYVVEIKDGRVSVWPGKGEYVCLSNG